MSQNLLFNIMEHAKTRPNAIAFRQILDSEEVVLISYGELYRRARVISTELNDAGLRKERALVALPIGIDFITAFLGCALAGVIAVPVFRPRFGRTDDLFISILEDCGAKTIISDDGYFTTDTQISIQRRSSAKLRWLNINAVHCIDTGDIQCTNVIDEAVLYIQYTSGSTALPKGVVIDQGNVSSNCGAIAQAFSFSSDDVFVSWLPAHHDMGLVGGLLMPLWLGAQGILLNPVRVMKRPRLWLETISRYKGTVSGGPNFAFELCTQKLSDGDVSDLDLSSWHTACVGAEPIRVSTLEQFSSLFSKAKFDSQAFRPSYGLAEATVMVTGGQYREGSYLSVAQDLYIGCGSPLANCQVEIVDPITNQPCPSGKVGEIWVNAPSVSRGYWQKPLETREAFENSITVGSEEKYLRTGDLGFLCENELFITGRLKELIIIRGVNHSPYHVESTVRESCAGLSNARIAAFSFSKDSGEKLAVVCESPPRWKTISPDLFLRIQGALSRRHVLRADAIVFIPFGSMPVTTSGKIQRGECRTRYLEGTFPVMQYRSYDLPHGPLESRSSNETIIDFLLVEICQSLNLDVSEVDPTSAISDIGLDSMAALRLAHLIDDQFKVALPIDIFLDRSSIAEIAIYITNAQSHRTVEPVATVEDVATILDYLTEDEIKTVLASSDR